MRSNASKALAGALAIIAAVALASCGGGDATAGPLGADGWRERAAAFCRDGLENATALPLPAGVPQLGPDAAARAEILASVRDGILTLDQPGGINSVDLGAYVDGLSADVDLLGRIARAARSGADVQELNGQLDESAGQLAGRLGLDDCAALSNAIARTP